MQKIARQRQKGLSVLPVLMVAGIGVTVAMSIPMVLQTYFFQSHYEQMKTTRDHITRAVERALENQFIIEHSLQNHNTLSLNPNFYNCIRATNPSSCSTEIGFYLAYSDADTNDALGAPSSNPSLYDAWGSRCLGSTDQCAFAVEITAFMECPVYSDTSCPNSKRVDFGYRIRPLSGGFKVPLRPSSRESSVRYAIDAHEMGYGVTLIN